MLLFDLKYQTKIPKVASEVLDDEFLNDYGNNSHNSNDSFLKVLSDTANETLGVNSTDSEQFEYVINKISVLQYILIFWVFSFLFEEFKQVRRFKLLIIFDKFEKLI